MTNPASRSAFAAAGTDVGLEEQIEVLGLAVDAGVLVDRVRAGDDVRDAGGVERLEGTPVDEAFVLRDPEIAVRERLPLLRRQASAMAVQVWAA